MSKTPFEIRADLLKQAQDFLVQQYIANTKFYTEMVAKSSEAITLDLKFTPPSYPTIQDILAEAKKFYSFVTTKE